MCSGLVNLKLSLHCFVDSLRRYGTMGGARGLDDLSFSGG